MFGASLAAAVLVLGTLATVAPAHAAPPQSGVILAQWGPGGAPPSPRDCWRLRRQLQQLYQLRYNAPPWQQPEIRSNIHQTRLQLRYNCPGF